MSFQPSTLNSLSRSRGDQPSVHLHIERLVLDGLPVSHGQSSFVQAAVETELTRLLAEQGLSRASAGALPHLTGCSIQLTHDSQPAHLGHQIAQAVYGGLTPTTASRRETRFPEGPHE